tara:strand:- start:173 stop:454 length:282 start_codon:yes stop_codon:yes gene_type:complete
MGSSSAETEDRRDLKSELERVLELLTQTQRENYSYRMCAAHTEMKNAALESQCNRLTDEVKTLRRTVEKLEAANALLSLKIESPDRGDAQPKT